MQSQFNFQQAGLWEMWSLISKQNKNDNSLGLFSCVKKLLDFSGVQCGLTDNPLNIADVGKTFLYLRDHFVQNGPVQWQCDRQDLLSHFLYALWVGSLLWAVQERTGTKGVQMQEASSYIKTLKQYHPHTSEKVFNFLNELCQVLIAFFKLVAQLVGFFQRVYRLVLQFLCHSSYVLELDTRNQESDQRNISLI